LGALLHDVAMVLTPDAFLHLIDPDSCKTRKLIPDLDTKPWDAEYDEYYNQARR